MQVRGWELLGHALLFEQLERLMVSVEKLKATKGDDLKSAANFKLLAAVYELMFVVIPSDPTRPEYRQGDTLGDGYKHWFRAKFGGQRFRLFFRFDTKAKVIIYAWVNDEDTKRTYGSKNDAYAVFRKMLNNGNPPDNWDALRKAAKTLQSIAPVERAKPAPERTKK
jgi:toxin YhaV